MKGRMAYLTPEKAIGKQTILSDVVYNCNFLSYDEIRESIFVELTQAELCDVSLDVIYDCRVIGENDITQIKARIIDRYDGKSGKILMLKIVEGFYKIPINKVDK